MDSPRIIAYVLPTPNIVSPSVLPTVKACVNSSITIDGTGLIGASDVKLYFRPKRKFFYTDISDYPLKTNQLILQLRDNRCWRTSSGPVTVIAIDTGGEIFYLNDRNGVVVANAIMTSKLSSNFEFVDYEVQLD